MCGIAGIIGAPRELSEPAVPNMLAAMAHRGPDCFGSTLVTSEHAPHPALLIHTRLAILDLSSAGTQPMSAPVQAKGSSRNWVVFNGEIFNFAALRRELEHKGYRFSSRSDTEVILHAYDLWDEQCVDRFQGMFAFCLVNPERNRVWLCRDRMGIKPLYFYRSESGCLLFASEVRTLLAAGDNLVKRHLSRTALESFFAQGAVFGKESIISDFELLEAGESLVLDFQGRRQSRKTYWSLASYAAPRADRIDRAAAAAQTAVLLREAVSLHLAADVPLGIFLSSGVDSTAIVAAAKEVHTSSLHTVTLSFDEPDYNEAPDAQRIAAELGTEHQTIPISGRFIIDHLGEALAALDQPTVDGFNTYFVSQATRRAGLTVALSGLGGDELFCGYATFRDVQRALHLRRRMRLLSPFGPVLAGLSGLAGGRAGAKLSELWKREISALACYLLRRELFFPGQRRALHRLPEESDALSGIPAELLSQAGVMAQGADTVQQISLFELSLYMRCMLLRDADVFSMASALEIRVPYLDHRLVEHVLGLPSSVKWDPHRPKSLLIEAAGQRFPRFAGRLPKRGFAFPWGAWLRGPLEEWAARACANRELWRSIGVDDRAVSGIWSRFQRHDPRILPLQVLAFIVLEDYARRHLV